MEKLAESYKKLNADVEIEVQQNDSTTGVTSAIDGICDIGMASRELKGYRDFSGCNRNTDRFGWNRSYREQTEPGR